MLHFHKAELGDAAAIATLINNAYRGESSRKGWTTEADWIDGLRTDTKSVVQIIGRHDAFMLIGVLQDVIVASICCELTPIDNQPIAQLGMIAVKPALQNRGYGQSLIHAAESVVKREWRVLGFHMQVLTIRHELIAFYERLGYERSGILQAFPENPALWQAKVANLTFEVLVKKLPR